MTANIQYSITYHTLHPWVKCMGVCRKCTYLLWGDSCSSGLCGPVAMWASCVSQCVSGGCEPCACVCACRSWCDTHTSTWKTGGAVGSASSWTSCRSGRSSGRRGPNTSRKGWFRNEAHLYYAILRYTWCMRVELCTVFHVTVAGGEARGGAEGVWLVSICIHHHSWRWEQTRMSHCRTHVWLFSNFIGWICLIFTSF